MEKRLHPRKNLTLDITLVAEGDDQQFSTSTRNLSMSGIQIHADKALVDHFMRQNKHPLHFNVYFCAQQTLAIHCRLIVNRRRSHNDFLIGANFINPTAEHKQLLTELLNNPS